MKSIAEPARRLSYGDGHWTLETTELRRLDRDLFRPEKRRISGTEAILAHLRSKGEGELLSSAERLIRVSDLDGSTYEAQDGEWVAAEPSVPSSRPSRMEELTHQVDELRAEVVLLRAAYSGLTSRLRKLERFLVEVEAGRARLSAAGVPDSPQIREREEGAKPPAPRADVTLKSGGTPDAVLGGVAASASASPLTLPGVPAVLACLRRLLGDGFTLESTGGELPVDPAELETFDASVFVDEAGAERAVALANPRALVELGGKLLGVPEEAQEEQLASGVVEPDLVLAMSEIFNNLCGLVGREPKNPKLQAQAVAKTPVERLPWLPAASATLALATPTGGRLWLVAR